MTKTLTNVLAYAVPSLLPAIIGWLYPSGLERHSSQSLLANELAPELFPGQSIWVRLGRRLAVEPSSALDLGAACAVSIGVALTLATTHRVAGRKGLLAAATVALTVPVLWGLPALAGPDSAIFASIALVLFASTYTTATITGSILTTAALVLCLLTWSYALVLWLGWFIFEVDRHTSRSTGSKGTLVLRPVHIRTLLPLVLSPALFILLWPYLEENTTERLLQVIGEPLQTPYPDVLVDGEYRSSASTKKPNIVEALALTAMCFPLTWTALSLVGGKHGLRLRKNGLAQGPLLLSACLIMTSALNGGPDGLPASGSACLLPALIFWAGIGLSVTVQWGYTNRSTVTTALGCAVFVLLLGTNIAQTTKRGLPFNTHIGSWMRPIPCTLPNTVIDALNSTAPLNIRLHIISKSPEYRELMQSLIERGRVRSGLQQVELFEATHVFTPHARDSYASNILSSLQGKTRFDLEVDGRRYLLVEL